MLYSGDSMGVIKSWNLDILERPDGTRSIRGTVVDEFTGHRTGVCSMVVSEGKIWSGKYLEQCIYCPLTDLDGGFQDPRITTCYFSQRLQLLKQDESPQRRPGSIILRLYDRFSPSCSPL